MQNENMCSECGNEIADALDRIMQADSQINPREGQLSWQVGKLEKDRDFFRNLAGELIATLCMERNREMLRGDDAKEALESLFEYADRQKGILEARYEVEASEKDNEPLQWKPRIYQDDREEE